MVISIRKSLYFAFLFLGLSGFSFSFCLAGQDKSNAIARSLYFDILSHKDIKTPVIDEIKLNGFFSEASQRPFDVDKEASNFHPNDTLNSEISDLQSGPGQASKFFVAEIKSRKIGPVITTQGQGDRTEWVFFTSIHGSSDAILAPDIFSSPICALDGSFGYFGEIKGIPVVLRFDSGESSSAGVMTIELQIWDHGEWGKLEILNLPLK
jgi:hypothetical protein